jgi:hypothetical protein
MPDWLQQLLPAGWTTTHLLWASIGLFVFSLVGSVLFAVYILVQIPADYFVEDSGQREGKPRHPLIRFPLLLLKNLFGVFLILLGIVLSLPGVPGQGILTILIGVMFLDVPVFRRLEKWIISRRRVLHSVNRIRARYGRDPLRFEGRELSNSSRLAE